MHLSMLLAHAAQIALTLEEDHGVDTSFNAEERHALRVYVENLMLAPEKPRLVPVILESPFAGDTDEILGRNLRYLRAAMGDCLRRGEAPYASHGLYTQPGVLDDNKPEERRLGIEAGFAWRPYARRTVVYIDYGITPGMEKGITHARTFGHEIDYRKLLEV